MDGLEIDLGRVATDLSIRLDLGAEVDEGIKMTPAFWIRYLVDNSAIN